METWWLRDLGAWRLGISRGLELAWALGSLEVFEALGIGHRLEPLGLVGLARWASDGSTDHNHKNITEELDQDADQRWSWGCAQALQEFGAAQRPE